MGAPAGPPRRVPDDGGRAVPLSDHEQRILEEIERRLRQDDPRLAQAVSSASVYGQLVRRIRLGVLGFIVGVVMLLFFAVSAWIALAGFGVMLGSALLVYHSLKRFGREHFRAGDAGPLSPTAFLTRLAERMRSRRAREEEEPPAD
jgi:hypothetical protein